MRGKLDLQIKDANYNDYILYKNLYDNVTVQYTKLLGQFNNMKREHNLLKDCYASAVAEKVRRARIRSRREREREGIKLRRERRDKIDGGTEVE